MIHWLHENLYALYLGGAFYWFTGKSFMNWQWWVVIVPTLFFVEIVKH